jgi:hypothetical protein
VRFFCPSLFEWSACETSFGPAMSSGVINNTGKGFESKREFHPTFQS